MTLRLALLEGRRVATAGLDPDGAIAVRAGELGAEVALIDAVTLGDEAAAAGWARARAPLHGLILDAREAFGAGGPEPLRSTLELAWRAARAVATGALLEEGTDGGRLVFIAPAAEAGAHAEAARAALESLARTLSVEWARFRVTAVLLAPGAATREDELAELACFVLSAAGGYLSGCRFDLGAVPVAS